MNLRVIIALERSKLYRRIVKDSAFFCLVVASLTLTLYLAFSETVTRSPYWNHVDKWLHFIFFGFFSVAFLNFTYFRFLKTVSPVLRTICLILALFLMAVMAESVQVFLPHRTFDIKDIMANLLGCSVFSLFYLKFLSLKNLDRSHLSVPSQLLPNAKDNRIRLRHRPNQDRNRGR